MNMNKIALVSAVVSSLFCVNSMAAAAYFKIKSGSHIAAIDTSEANAEDKCNGLSDNVTINLSRNVVGTYSCDEKDLGGLKVGVGHSAGLRKAGSIDCAVVGNKTTSNATSGQIESVPYFNDAAKCTVSKPNAKFPIANGSARSWVGSGSGGSIGAVPVAIAATETVTSEKIAAEMAKIFK